MNATAIIGGFVLVIGLGMYLVARPFMLEFKKRDKAEKEKRGGK